MKFVKAFALLFALVIVLSGCSVFDVLSNDSIETLEDWSFQYNDGTKDYSLFFALCNDKGKNISSDATVDIKIINSAGDIVFQGTKKVSKSDFGYYSSQNEGERFLANLRIPVSEISPGKASDGTVYFTVYKENAFRFDECNCRILYSLPTMAYDVTAGQLPVEVKVKSYDGSIQSKLTIESVSCEAEGNIFPTIKVVISGKKTYGNGSGLYDMFNYKLYDSQSYMVKSGTVYLDSLNSGDKFRDDLLILYDIVPGEKYELMFFDCE